MLLPRQDKFFDLFDKQAENIAKAAELYHQLVEKADFSPEKVRRMHEMEHYGDELTHSTINTLNETFITPFDREDILALANRLDDIMDNIYLLTKRFHLYKISQPTQVSKRLASVIEQTTKALQHTLAALRNKKHMKET